MNQSINEMKIKAFAVIDTNVFVSMLKSLENDSAVTTIGDLINNRNIIPVFDARIISEYYSVLKYPKFGFSTDIIENFLSEILSKGIYVDNIKQLQISFRDESDIPFYEVMMDTQDLPSVLVTGNTKHFPVGCCVNPQQLVHNLKYLENFVVPLKKEHYDKMIELKIIEITSTKKYYLGNLLPKKFIDKLKERRLLVNEYIKIADYID